MLFKREEKDFSQELLNAYVNRNICPISKKKYKKASKYLKEYFLKEVKDGVITTTINIYHIYTELRSDVYITEDETKTAIITFLKNNHLKYEEKRTVTTLTSKEYRALEEIKVYLIDSSLAIRLSKEGIIE